MVWRRLINGESICLNLSLLREIILHDISLYSITLVLADFTLQQTVYHVDLQEHCKPQRET